MTRHSLKLSSGLRILQVTEEACVRFHPPENPQSEEEFLSKESPIRVVNSPLKVVPGHQGSAVGVVGSVESFAAEMIANMNLCMVLASLVALVAPDPAPDVLLHGRRRDSIQKLNRFIEKINRAREAGLDTYDNLSALELRQIVRDIFGTNTRLLRNEDSPTGDSRHNVVPGTPIPAKESQRSRRAVVRECRPRHDVRHRQQPEPNEANSYMNFPDMNFFQPASRG